MLDRSVGIGIVLEEEFVEIIPCAEIRYQVHQKPTRRQEKKEDSAYIDK
jgi:hypothetical protein